MASSFLIGATAASAVMKDRPFAAPSLRRRRWLAWRAVKGRALLAQDAVLAALCFGPKLLL
jgi:hypothetical protein